MFLPRSLPLTLDESGLHGLRVALNTPVLSIQELPPGPATAAIVLNAEKGGERALTIAVRALRGGEVVFFTLGEDLSDDAALLGAIDGALSFAEAMGFLFDEELDVATQAERRRALAHWREVVGEPKKGSMEVAASIEELVLEEAVELEEAEPRQAPPPPRPPEGSRAGSHHREGKAQAVAGSKAASPKGVSLTKFRKRGGAPSAPSGPPRPEEGGRATPSPQAQPPKKAVLMTPHGPALGRLQLIKRRRSGDQAGGTSWLARLLGSF
jgi:hypothetical protein